MSEVVTDASLIIKPILREAMRFQARQFIADCKATETQMIAPPIFESEIDSIIRRHVFEDSLTSADGGAAYLALALVPVQIVTPPGLRQRAREIAAQADQRAVYDSTYAALAELRGCEFWTADRAFYNAVHNDLPFVHYLAEYP